MAQSFRESRNELGNVGINYYYDIEKANTSDLIAGVESLGEKGFKQCIQKYDPQQ